MLRSLLTKLNDEAPTTSYTCKYLLNYSYIRLFFENIPGKEKCYPLKI